MSSLGSCCSPAFQLFALPQRVRVHVVRGSLGPLLGRNCSMHAAAIHSVIPNNHWLFSPPHRNGEWGKRGGQCCQTVDIQTCHWFGSELSMSGQETRGPRPSPFLPSIKERAAAEAKEWGIAQSAANTRQKHASKKLCCAVLRAGE